MDTRQIAFTIIIVVVLAAMVCNAAANARVVDGGGWMGTGWKRSDSHPQGWVWAKRGYGLIALALLLIVVTTFWL